MCLLHSKPVKLFPEYIVCSIDNSTLSPLLGFLLLHLLCLSLALCVFRCSLACGVGLTWLLAQPIPIGIAQTKTHVYCAIRCLGWRHQLCATDSEERQHHWHVASLGRWKRWISTVSRDCRALEGHEHLRAGTHTHTHMQLPLLPNLSRNAPCLFSSKVLLLASAIGLGCDGLIGTAALSSLTAPHRTIP